LLREVIVLLLLELLYGGLAFNSSTLSVVEEYELAFNSYDSESVGVYGREVEEDGAYIELDEDEDEDDGADIIVLVDVDGDIYIGFLLDDKEEEVGLDAAYNEDDLVDGSFTVD